MISNFDNYVDGVLISASCEQWEWRTDMPPKLYNALHATVGFVTEVGELLEALQVTEAEIDWVNVKEELGD